MSKIKSADEYIASNDFRGAKSRLNHSNARWKSHWFNTCLTIAENKPSIFDKYEFNYEDYTIVKIQIIKYAKEKAVPPHSFASSHTYLVTLQSPEENVFFKVGKANDIEKRLSQIVDKGYVGENIVHADIIKTYDLPSEDLAEALESCIKHYIKSRKEVKHYPKDRFEPFLPTEEDFDNFDLIRETILALFV